MTDLNRVADLLCEADAAMRLVAAYGRRSGFAETTMKLTKIALNNLNAAALLDPDRESPAWRDLKTTIDDLKWGHRKTQGSQN